VVVAVVALNKVVAVAVGHIPHHCRHHHHTERQMAVAGKYSSAAACYILLPPYLDNCSTSTKM
jgi:hypothetical protein